MVELPKVKRSWSPEERARRTLLRYLSPAQKEMFKANGYFEVKAPDGNTYRVHTTAAAEKALKGNGYLRLHSRPYYAEHYRLHRLSRLEGKPVHAWPVYSYAEKPYAYQHYPKGQKGVMPEADMLLALKLMLETYPARATVGCSIPLG